MRSSTIAILLLVAPALAAQEKDHPLLTGYPGATITKKEVKDYDEQIMLLSPIGPKGSYAAERLEGRVTRMNYADPPGRSPLEKYRNYESALKNAGFEIVWTCAGYEPCGPQVNVPGIGYFPYGETSRYLTARLKRPQGDVWVGLQVKPAWTDVQIVEVKPMDTGMVRVSAAALTKGILAEGHVPVYGIYFDVGKADIKPESTDTLKEIAKLLQTDASLKLHVVGHTDNDGARRRSWQR